MSGMRPAPTMIRWPCEDIMNLRNWTASFWCFEYFMTEKPSPEYWMTPCCGRSENGSTNGATFEPIDFWNVAASQLPSEIIAAFPLMNAPRMFVFVSTALFVQPRFRSETQLLSWAEILADVHGMWPVYSAFQSAG